MKIVYGLRDYYRSKEILYLVVHLNSMQTPKTFDFSKRHDPKIYIIIYSQSDPDQIYVIK